MNSLISSYIKEKGEYTDIPKTATTLSLKDRDTNDDISSIMFDKTSYGYHIILIVTDEKHRNRRLAKYLVNTILAKRIGEEYVTCNVLFSESYNITFWKKCGFNSHGLLDGYIQMTN